MEMEVACRLLAGLASGCSDSLQNGQPNSVHEFQKMPESSRTKAVLSWQPFRFPNVIMRV